MRRSSDGAAIATRLRAIPSLPARPADGHKGTFGHLLILAGSSGMIGAPILCGLSALRCGCGLAYLAAPEEVLPWVLMHVPELVGVPLGKAPQNSRFEELATKAAALAAGPGMGTGAASLARLKKLLRLGKPCVLDADAITLLAKEEIMVAGAQLVLTPHPGEMARLARWLKLGDVPQDEEGRIQIAVAAARRLRQVILLKGHHTIITDGQQYRVNESGDTSLSKAGTGDVLTGVIGSLLAQGMAPFDAASLGAHLHGLAGETAGHKLGVRSVLARDVAECLHTAISMHHPTRAG